MRTADQYRAAGAGVSEVPTTPPVARILALAGIIGPILFTGGFILQALFRPGYSHIAQPVSALTAGPTGWVQQVNFFVFGPLMIAYAIGLHVVMRGTRRAFIGPALLMLSGVGLVLAGVFPARDASGAFSVGPAHMAAAFTAFVPAGVGLIVVSRRMVRDPSWARLASYTLGSGIAMTVLFLATGPLAVPDDAPLHGVGGLLQRATVLVWFSATIVLATRMRRVANVGRRMTDHRASTLTLGTHAETTG